MIPNPAQDDLWHIDHGAYREAYYKAIRRAPEELSGVIHLLSEPEAIPIPHIYRTQQRRILIVGKETYDNLSPLGKCVDKEEDPFRPWSRQIGETISFDYGYGSNPKHTPFWQAFDEVKDAFGLPSRKAVAWSNILKVQLLEPVDGKKNYSAGDHKDARPRVAKWQKELVHAELSWIDPSAILFLTGPLQEYVENDLFETEKYQLSKFDFGAMTVNGRSIPIAHAYHPRYGSREERMRLIEGLKNTLQNA